MRAFCCQGRRDERILSLSCIDVLDNTILKIVSNFHSKTHQIHRISGLGYMIDRLKEDFKINMYKLS